MPTVLLAGAFGRGNPSDEALLHAFLGRLGGWDAVATSADPLGTEHDHGCAAVRSAHPWDVGRELLQVDAVVFAGGMVFKTLHPSTRRRPNDRLLKSLALATAARVMRKPVAILGVGAAHLDGVSRILAAAVARRSQLLVLRDEESAALLQRCGMRPPFRVGADPAWVLFDTDHRPASRGSGVVVSLSELRPAQAITDVTLAVTALASEGTRVRLQPWCSGRDTHDEGIVQWMAQESGAEMLPPPTDIFDASRTYAGCALVVGTHYHGLMAAAAVGVPSVAYAHRPEVAGIARRLRQPTVRPGDGTDRFVSAVHAAIGGSPPSRATVAAEAATAEDAFRLLRLLLDRGRTTDPADVPSIGLTPPPRTP